MQPIRFQPVSQNAITLNRMVVGHYAEITLLGKKLIPAVIQNDYRFTQQLDPHTGKGCGPQKNGFSRQDAYGPMMLTVLEYMSRMHGIHLDVANDQIWWSAPNGDDFTYTQRWGDRIWTLIAEKNHFTANLDGKELFSCNRGTRVVTNLEGKAQRIVGIESSSQTVTFQMAGSRHEFLVKPNEVWSTDGVKYELLRAAPFNYPYQKQNR